MKDKRRWPIRSLLTPFKGDAMAMIEDVSKTKSEEMFLRVLGLLGEQLKEGQWAQAIETFKKIKA